MRTRGLEQLSRSVGGGQMLFSFDRASGRFWRYKHSADLASATFDVLTDRLWAMR